jgi:hypothetical protein
MERMDTELSQRIKDYFNQQDPSPGEKERLFLAITQGGIRRKFSPSAHSSRECRSRQLYSEHLFSWVVVYALRLIAVH